MVSSTDNINDPLVLSKDERDQERSKLKEYNSRERDNYNKKVEQLNESLKRLENTQQALSNLNASEPILKNISALISDTHRLTQDTLQNNLVNHKEQAEFLTSYYRSVEAALQQNMKATVRTQDNQLMTLQEVLSTYKKNNEDKKTILDHDTLFAKFSSWVTEKSDNSQATSTQTHSSDGSALKEMVDASKDPTIAAISAVSPQLGVLVQSMSKPVAQIASTASSIVKGTKSVFSKMGDGVSSLFSRSSGVQSAKKIENTAISKQRETKKREDDKKHKELIDKLDEVKKAVNHVDVEGGGGSGLGTAVSGFLGGTSLLEFGKKALPVAGKVGAVLHLANEAHTGVTDVAKNVKKTGSLWDGMLQTGNDWEAEARKSSAWENTKGLLSIKAPFHLQELMRKGLNKVFGREDKLSQPTTPPKSATKVDKLGASKYTDDAVRIANKYGIDPADLLSTIQTESGGDPFAQSKVGAKGLTQFMPSTWKQYGGGKDIYDPIANMEASAKYKRDLLKQFDGDINKANAAYNWGPSNVNKAISKYGNNWLSYAPKETRDYVSRNQKYSAMFRGSPVTATTATLLADQGNMPSAMTSDRILHSTNLQLAEASNNNMADKLIKSNTETLPILANSISSNNQTQVAQNNQTQQAQIIPNNPTDIGLIALQTGVI